MTYDPKRTEDEWFAVHEKDLIQQVKIERERTQKELQRVMQKEEARKQKELHWMHCPKCGAELFEDELLGIKVDECPLCDGIFFDQSELQDLMLKSGKERREIVLRILRIPLSALPAEGGNEEEILQPLQAARARKDKELTWVLEQGETRTRKELHWMKCPKCGSVLKEENYEGATVDMCPVCGGVYMDRVDFQALLLKRKDERRNAFMRIIRVFSS